MQKLNPVDHDSYISNWSDPIQLQLMEIRSIIGKAIPDAKEVISYQMPAYKTTEVLVYYAAFKNHISLFPTKSGVENFKDLLKDYTTSKGTIHFEPNKKLPKKLITQIVKFRAIEAEEKWTKKIKKK
jgi:uncharacterized protein YdhG (YjbR/CyaY superfamily)